MSLRRSMIAGVLVAIFSASNSAAIAQHIYWADIFAAKLQRSCLNGLAVRDLVAVDSSVPRNIALDPAGGKIYWTVGGMGKIQRANLDGTMIEDVLTGGVGIPAGLALDVPENKIYWAEGYGDSIRRCNFDGSGVEVLVTGDLVDPSALALDLSQGKMYWTEPVAERIRRANLDGSSVEELVTGTKARGIALDVPSGKMYWTDPVVDKILRANLDGTDIEAVVVGIAAPRGIALDLPSGKIYWTDTFTDMIQRANLDGSDIEDLVTVGLEHPVSIALDLTPCGGPDCQPNGSPDACDLCEGTSLDCNGNSIPDECEVPPIAPAGEDCNANLVPDECEPDCNQNDVADECDIRDGTSTDVNADAMPDECEDCNENGLPDECDLDCLAAAGHCEVADCGLSPDCNANDLPDECDLAVSSSEDCNSNAVPDECEVPPIEPGGSDCNGNVIPDECEIDCQPNGVPDDCDISGGVSTDCNDNEIPDQCDLASGDSEDCDGNDVPDECQRDCNHNGVDDSCDVAMGTSEDCQPNGIPDRCESDCNGNDVPDDCDIASGITLPCAIIEFAPRGAIGPHEIRGNEMIISAGDVQVEFEILVSGWGNAPGSPLLAAYNIVLDGESLRGYNTNPYNPGVNLTTPVPIECGTAGDCPQPLPPVPFTQSGTCGVIFPRWCDDFEPAFFLPSVCSDDLATPCRSYLNCPVGAGCVDNPRFVFPSYLNPLLGIIDRGNDFFQWLGLPWNPDVGREDPDGTTRFLVANLRLIVPEDARGTYTIEFFPGRDFTFLLESSGITIPSTIISGQLTIGGACCMADDSCEILLEDECEAAGGAFLGGFCGDDSDNDGTVDACDPCPNDNPDDSDGDGVCNSDDGCPFDPNKIEPGQCGCGVDDHADSDDDGIADCDDQCPGIDDPTFAPHCVDAIPTVSTWGLLILSLLLLTAGKLAFGHSELRVSGRV